MLHRLTQWHLYFCLRAIVGASERATARRCAHPTHLRMTEDRLSTDYLLPNPAFSEGEYFHARHKFAVRYTARPAGVLREGGRKRLEGPDAVVSHLPILTRFAADQQQYPVAR